MELVTAPGDDVLSPLLGEIVAIPWLTSAFCCCLGEKKRLMLCWDDIIIRPRKANRWCKSSLIILLKQNKKYHCNKLF